RFFLFLFLFSPFILMAQKRTIKVDLNQAGRSSSEVNELGYQSWTLTKAADSYKKFGNVEIHFSAAGEKGFYLNTDWYKAGIHETYNAKLISDGITLEDTVSEKGLLMSIEGLSSGEHTLLAFLNVVQSAKGNTFSPIDIYVNGELKVSHIKPTVRAL